MTDETKNLSEDEQFAAMTTGNPLFGEATAGAAPGAVDTTDDGAGAQGPDQTAASAATQDDGATARDVSDGNATVQAGADGTQGGSGQGADEEPFPGYANLSPEVREAFDNLSKKSRKFENDYRALHGMMAPTQRQNAELRRQVETTTARIQQLEQVGRTQGNAGAATDDAQNGFDEWAAQFPEESRMLQALVNPLREEVKSLKGQLSAARTELGSLSSDREQAALEREVSALELKHADWRDIHNSPSYWEWLERQPPGIQALNASMNALDTISLLDIYKGSLATTTAVPAQSAQTGTADAIQHRRTQALERGTAPNVRSPESTGSTGGNPGGAMSDDDAAFLQLVGDNPNFR
ncbi:hypothetical protein [Luteibacter yeojuensis]|uniref:Uncharacterized protein n=1 Tax=Luteibacter yeojuensis TaxID=345309 RepID=A0A7X5QTF0_9GAMM|nr:hypothetical protein [Luteibacter yeojuensis]NID14967.1 hypothetical protein [Luteibacter yeojuensis]